MTEFTRQTLLKIKTLKLDKLSYKEVITNGIKVMDSAAVSLCMENNIPIVVFDVRKPGNLERVVKGESVGSLVEGEAL